MFPKDAIVSGSHLERAAVAVVWPGEPDVCLSAAICQCIGVSRKNGEEELLVVV
jgi:hypothetical protein